MSLLDEVNQLRKVFLQKDLQRLEHLDERLKEPKLEACVKASLLRERQDLLASTQERGGALDRLEVLLNA